MSEFSLCLASPATEFCRYPSGLRPKIFVNRCYACSGTEEKNNGQPTRIGLSQRSKSGVRKHGGIHAGMVERVGS